MTEPTDDEIMELAKPFITRVGSHWENDDAIPDNGRIEDFARAVLAKWGQPAGEPCEPAADGVCERLDCQNHGIKKGGQHEL